MPIQMSGYGRLLWKPSAFKTCWSAPILTTNGVLTVTDLNDLNGPAQTTNLGVRSSNLFGRAIFPPLP